MSYVLAMAPLTAEEDLRALKIATNPHMVKKMRDLFDWLMKQATWLRSPTSEPEKTSEQKYYEGVAAIEKARGGK